MSFSRKVILKVLLMVLYFHPGSVSFTGFRSFPSLCYAILLKQLQGFVWMLTLPYSLLYFEDGSPIWRGLLLNCGMNTGIFYILHISFKCSCNNIPSCGKASTQVISSEDSGPPDFVNWTSAFFFWIMLSGSFLFLMNIKYRDIKVFPTECTYMHDIYMLFDFIFLPLNFTIDFEVF